MFSDELRRLVKHNHDAGKSYTEIALILNIPRNSVISIMNYKVKSVKQKRGRKNLISDKIRLRIKRLVETSNAVGKIINCNTVRTELDMNLSRRTINNHFLRSDFKYLKIRQQIGLSKEHKEKRLSIVSQWIERNIDWKSVVFTDEKRFTLDGPDNLYVTFFINLYIAICIFLVVPINVLIQKLTEFAGSAKEAASWYGGCYYPMA